MNPFNSEMGTNYDAKRFVREYIGYMKKRDANKDNPDESDKK